MFAGADGEPERVIGLLTDMSSARFSEERQRLAMAVVDNAAQGVVVTDTCSTKADVLQWATELLPESAHFVGGHPMAGREQHTT